MKTVFASYSEQGLLLANHKDEIILRNAIIDELKSLVNQRKHWLLQSHSTKMWVYTTLSELEQFCELYKTRSLHSVAMKVLQIEGKFALILPKPDGKHACRYNTFYTIIKILTAYEQAYTFGINIPGQRQR